MRKLLLIIVLLTSCQLFAQEAVDLGLSVKWGNMNIGASDPFDGGEHFSWGETVAKDKYRFKPSNYICNLDTKKYNSIKGNKEYDVAAKRLGGYWRMPTPYECRELFRNSTINYIHNKAKNSYYWEIIGPNGNKIFFQNSGYIADNGISSFGVYFWTTRYDEDGYAISAQLDNFGAYGPWAVQREAVYYGLVIRPVYDTIREMENNKNPIISKLGYAFKCEKMAYEEEKNWRYTFDYLKIATEKFEELRLMTGFEKYISEQKIDAKIRELENEMKDLNYTLFEEYKKEKKKQAESSQSSIQEENSTPVCWMCGKELRAKDISEGEHIACGARIFKCSKCKRIITREEKKNEKCGKCGRSIWK